MSSFETGEAKEDDAVQYSVASDVPEIPTEAGGAKECSSRSTAEATTQTVITEPSAIPQPSSEYTDLTRLHNESEPKGGLSKQDSNQSIKSMIRKVSFPMDTELVTSYLEPVNPWAEGRLCAQN